MKNDKNKPQQTPPHNRGEKMPVPKKGEKREDAQIENPDQAENPDKKIEFDDNPEETKRKIPNA